MSLDRPLRLGARKSPLARAQVDLVAGWLAARGVPTVYVGLTTSGDVDRRHLSDIGGTGVFVSAVRDALRVGEIDVAVHSCKDLPTAAEPGLEIVAVPAREDTRDVLIGRRLADLAGRVRIGTGAPRRAVQLLDWAQRQRATGRDVEIEIVPIRGNVATRMRYAADGVLDAVVLAAAGLRRLGLLSDAATNAGAEVGRNSPEIFLDSCPGQLLDPQVMLPAPGQGALALEIDSTLNGPARTALAGLDDAVARAEVVAERAFLAELEAGCTAPVGARAIVKSVRDTSTDLTLDAVIGKTLLSNVSGPGKSGAEPKPVGVLRWQAHGAEVDPVEFGIRQARAVLAKLPPP